MEAALQAAEEKQTMLTKWFNLNNCDPNAKHYLYTKIPKVIGRMYHVTQNDRNRFYLDMLLLHVRGATLFTD